MRVAIVQVHVHLVAVSADPDQIPITVVVEICGAQVRPQIEQVAAVGVDRKIRDRAATGNAVAASAIGSNAATARQSTRLTRAAAIDARLGAVGDAVLAGGGHAQASATQLAGAVGTSFALCVGCARLA